MALPWSVADTLSVTPLEKLRFPLSQQLSILNGFLVWGRSLCQPLPSPCRGFPWIEFVQVLSMQPVSEFTCVPAPLCPESTVSLKSSATLVLTIFLLPLPCKRLSREECNIVIPFMDKLSKVSHSPSLPVVDLSLCLFPFTTRRSSSDGADQ